MSTENSLALTSSIPLVFLDPFIEANTGVRRVYLNLKKKKTLFINLPAIFIFISVTHSSKAGFKHRAPAVPS